MMPRGALSTRPPMLPHFSMRPLADGRTVRRIILEAPDAGKSVARTLENLDAIYQEVAMLLEVSSSEYPLRVRGVASGSQAVASDTRQLCSHDRACETT